MYRNIQISDSAKEKASEEKDEAVEAAKETFGWFNFIVIF